MPSRSSKQGAKKVAKKATKKAASPAWSLRSEKVVTNGQLY
jgi:hypothetical protein